MRAKEVDAVTAAGRQAQGAQPQGRVGTRGPIERLEDGVPRGRVAGAVLGRVQSQPRLPQRTARWVCARRRLRCPQRPRPVALCREERHAYDERLAGCCHTGPATGCPAASPDRVALASHPAQLVLKEAFQVSIDEGQSARIGRLPRSLRITMQST